MDEWGDGWMKSNEWKDGKIERWMDEEMDG